MFSFYARAQGPAAPGIDPVNDRLNRLETELHDLKAKLDAEDATPLIEPPQAAPLPEFNSVDPRQSFTSLGPVESKIYVDREARWQAGLSSAFFSYAQQTGGDRSNVTSLAPTFAMRLHRRLLFNSQVLLENGGAESSDTVTLQKGQVVVTMAYVDWLANDRQNAGLRVGHQFIPIGLSNSRNGPTTYFSVLRPELERALIPSPWHENGVLAWVDRPHATFEMGAFSSLDASGFRGDTFLAGGRSQGQNSLAEDLMGVFRLQAKSENLRLGGSLALGHSGQGSNSLRSGAFQLGEIHAEAHFRRALVQGMLTVGQLQDATAISLQNATVMGEQAKGSSLEGAYDLIGGDQKLWLFSRYARYNLHDRVPQGFLADPSLNRSVWTSGFCYSPLNDLQVKADYVHRQDAAGNRQHAFELGLALIY